MNKDLCENLNKLSIKQISTWENSIPQEVWETHFQDKDGKWNFETVSTNLDVDKHRWYETSITVIKINGGYIGIRLVSNLFSEVDSISDIEWSLIFMEMELVVTTTYIQKKSINNLL